MKVDNTDGVNRIRQAYGVNVRQVSNNSSAKDEENAVSSDFNDLSREKVTISSLGQEIQKVKNAVKADPGIREEKIAQLRQAIANGEYGVSNEELADKIAQYFFDE